MNDDDETWMGRPIDGMTREELATALKTAVRQLRSVAPSPLAGPDVEVLETADGTIVSRTFKWAFIPAGYLWSDDDRRAVQSRLDAFGARHGLPGAVVRFGDDTLEVEVPQRLEVEQLRLLQEWLDSEREALDVSQVP